MNYIKKGKGCRTNSTTNRYSLLLTIVLPNPVSSSLISHCQKTGHLTCRRVKPLKFNDHFVGKKIEYFEFLIDLLKRKIQTKKKSTQIY